MPIDTSIYGGGGQSSSGGGGFDFLGNMMKWQQFGQQVENNKLLREQRQQLIDQRQEQIDDDNAINDAMQRFSKPRVEGGSDDDNVDWGGMLNDLDQNGYGRAALNARGKIFAFRAQQAQQAKAQMDNNIAQYRLATNIIRDVHSQEELQRALPTLQKLVPNAAQFIPTTYDPAVFNDLIEQGRTHTEALAEERWQLEKGQKIMEGAQRFTKSNQDWQQGQQNLKEDLIQYWGGWFATAKDEDKWNTISQLASKSMDGLDPGTKEEILGLFGGWNVDAPERAMMATMSPEKLSEYIQAGDAPELSEASIRAGARGAYLTGVVPKLGQGTVATKANIAIRNFMSKERPDFNAEAQATTYKAVMPAIVQQVKNLSNIRQFSESTVQAVENVVTQAENMRDRWFSTRSPWANKKLGEVYTQAGGADKQMLTSLLEFAMPEITKILNNPGLGNAGATVSARRQMNEAISADMNIDTLIPILRMAVSEIRNREDAAAQGVRSLVRRLGADEKDQSFNSLPELAGLVESTPDELERWDQRNAQRLEIEKGIQQRNEDRKKKGLPVINYGPIFSTGSPRPDQPQEPPRSPGAAAAPTTQNQTTPTDIKPGVFEGTVKGPDGNPMKARMTVDAQGNRTVQAIGPDGKPMGNPVPMPRQGGQQAAPAAPAGPQLPGVTAQPGITTPPRTIPIQPEFKSQIPGGVEEFRGRNLSPGGTFAGPATVTQPPRQPRAPSDYINLISRSSSTYGVDPQLVMAIMGQESAGDPGAVSRKGAQGLMQLMPDTAKELGVTDVFNPAQNIDAGTKYISQLLKRYGGDLDKALMAYNAGMGAVDSGKAARFKETQDYVARIKRRLASMRRRQSTGSF